MTCFWRHKWVKTGDGVSEFDAYHPGGFLRKATTTHHIEPTNLEKCERCGATRSVLSGYDWAWDNRQIPGMSKVRDLVEPNMGYHGPVNPAREEENQKWFKDRGIPGPFYPTKD